LNLNVYIVGVEEGLFPSLQTIDSEKGLEEERRLFYVAVTRAEDNATISFARSRYKYGELTFSRPSRFIGDIDQAFLDVNVEDIISQPQAAPSDNRPISSDRSAPGRSFKSLSNQSVKPKINLNYNTSDSKPKVNLNYNSASPDEVVVGMKVEHERFGRGEVINLEGDPPNKKATVMFQNAGQKQLLLKFAKLKILP